MTKDLMFLMSVLPDVYICFHRKSMFSSIANSLRILTEINESSTVAKIRM